MSQNDYIILRDEDGTPYIAHAGLLDNARNAIRGAANSISTTAQQVANKAKGVGRRVRQNHKYILKVFENGKTRYFYKPEEVKAYYEAKRKGIKNPAEYAQKAANVASNTVDAVKNVASKAGNAAKSAFREATGQAARDRMDTAAARRDTEAVNMHNANTRRQKAENDKAIAEQKRAEALSDIKNARTAQRGLQEKMDKDADRISAVDRKKNNDEYNRRVDSWNLSKRALDTQRQKEMDGYRRENSSADKIKAAKKEIDSATSEHTAARDAYQEADSNYNKNKAAYDKSLAGAVDRTAARAKETASSAFSKAKDAANNTVSNAKSAYERMKSEFKNKAQKTAQAAVDATINKAAYEAPRAVSKVKEAASDLMDTAKRKTGITAKEYVEKAERELIQAKRDSAKTEQVRREVTKNGEPDSYGNKWHKTEQEARRAGDAELAAERARNEVINKENSLNYARSRYKETPLGKAEGTKDSSQDMLDRARVAVKDKSEDLSAKAKSTVQSARDSVKGMIDNARSSTAKAVNEAWDKIPKNADGTVNPFDKNFQSTYNDWKAKKDKYDSSLAGRAKDAAEKATDAVQDMIDQAKKVVKGTSASRSQYSEYRDNDKDFAEKNYSNKNHVEDTDFYTFKRDDGKWVILEEDMKWVLPEGVTGNDPGIRNALKQFADRASSAKAIGNENNNNDQWVDAVTDAIDKAAYEAPRAVSKVKEAASDLMDTAKRKTGITASRSQYSEYRDNDKDFAEKNYSNKNHVEDTDFYTFKRDDGKWVILEEDMKWVLPEGVTGNDPGIRNALKQFADRASSAKAIGNENNNNDQWVDAVTDAIDKAAEKQRKK